MTILFTKQKIVNMFILTLVFLYISLTNGLYSDQVGITDRNEFHTGPIQSLVGIGNKGFLLSSYAGVIARINQRTGDKYWRVVLPDGMYKSVYIEIIELSPFHINSTMHFRYFFARFQRKK